MNTAEIALETAGKGMGSLFVTVTVMMLVVALLQRFTRRWNEERQHSAVGSRDIEKSNDCV